MGITHILTVANKIQPRFPNDFVYKIVECIDQPDEKISPLFSETNSYIDKVLEDQNTKLLIHCFAGKSRATSFTLAYLIERHKMSLKDGLDLIWKVRPIAEPNKGFMI